jgi:hypothetical protein
MMFNWNICCKTFYLIKQALPQKGDWVTHQIKQNVCSCLNIDLWQLLFAVVALERANSSKLEACKLKRAREIERHIR